MSKNERIAAMKNLVILMICVLALSGAVLAQTIKTPTFSGYGVRVEKIRSTTVDISNKDARMYRTNLRNAAKGGVNFAGHYILTSWGCGTNCNVGAIIDARNGKVFFPAQLAGFGVGFESWLGDDDPLEFKPGSKLLILKGYANSELDKEHPVGGYYYLFWNGTALKQIKFVRKSDKA
jgi:hypothetical protein